jgi:3-methylcrotonyl-CoA carboxylase alpha subunit
MITKLLIANRGEIACRIMATAQARGIACVAVYSDADAQARHVRLADQAVHIGGASPTDSYLRGDRIIQAAQDTGADAIHPGYGFLSENPDFVDAVTAAGLIFVGPSGDAIRAMGLKDRAKALMIKAGVPVVPGYHGADQTDDLLRDEADKIGYPVMIKAVAGGGGKGMRLAETALEFDDQLASARAESRTAFGNDAVLIEKFVTAPRHIEVQIFGDGTQAIHLFERDCSLQRRHQKVIEEAPAPGMSDAVRSAMGAAAVKAAQAIGYSGAGTVEFIVDGSGPLRTDGFWFMEMNTRLQVEHPVTEAITGIDLVDWQLRVAAGEPLPMRQEDVKIQGHAFEARLYAEDATQGFLPAIGRLTHLTFPDIVRADTGVEAGDEITPHYDPMIAKVIVHGPDRASALAMLINGLAGTQVAGTVTNLGFLTALASGADFAAGHVDTGLIARHLDSLTAAPVPTPADLAQAALALSGVMARHGGATGFALHAPLTWSIDLGDSIVLLTVHNSDHVTCDVAGQAVDAQRLGNIWRFDGQKARPQHLSGRVVTLFGAAPMTFTQPDPLDRISAGQGGDTVLTPMPGLLRDIFVAVGDDVQEGDRLAVLEAMKMEHVLCAPRAGKISAIHAVSGSQVQAGIALISLEVIDATDD